MALVPDVTVSIVFGVFMALVALLGLWQVAYYAARGRRALNWKHDSEGGANVQHSLSLGVSEGRLRAPIFLND
ncbi:uncharacterized protein A1O5_04238 [Cladophialophora psammophila CBS 110553]|uniref:Uncharacterized protein n=1 Tax=Cladophialophora psammophila CBS 110553 TaxID=1182543 RepID=W9XS15_9EURO|nr:uncharacterized protein A1O5_04238 [Cladophialophora psammophila CBS 110553]EXJ73089.1 hypothetical protein A1O5_04238 [Cladophialophora psammophila CBS 110553]